MKEFIKKYIEKYIKGDYVIWFIYALLCMASVLVIFSASARAIVKSATITGPIMRHIAFLVSGFIVLLLVYSRSKKTIKLFSWMLLLFCVVLLAFLLVAGVMNNGAARSFEGLFQPSEFAKFALIIVAADFIDKFQDKEFLNKYFKFYCAVVWITVGLIFPMSLSMAIIIFLPILVMMMVGSIPWKKIGFFVAVPVACVFLLACIASIIPKKSNNSALTVAVVDSRHQKSIGEKVIDGTAAALNRFRFDTWTERVKNHVDIAEKWTEIDSNSEKQDMFDSQKYKQVMLARCAIHNGKVSNKQGEGLGPGNSTWRNRLPAVSRDFVYALIVEEYSWLGALGVIFLYMWLLWRGGVLIRKTDTVFSAVAIVGAAMVIVFQAFVHIGVNVGVLPVTGQTLPLLSQGGTSIWVISAFFGLILGMSKRAEEGKPQTAEDEEKNDENTPSKDNTDKKVVEPAITPINSELDTNTTEFVITEI